MMIKKKSLLVAVVSSVVVSLVLILTLIAYIIYLELKSGESKMAYRGLLKKVEANIYSNHR